MAISGSIRPTQRYLLCRPRGGLNDTFCQIEKCWRYACKFDRILVIDTRNSGLHSNFSEFFEPSRKFAKIIFDATDELFQLMNGLTCFPNEIRGRLHQLDLCSLPNPNFALKDDPLVPASFDFTKDYAQAVLVHEQCGGGRLSLRLLEKLYISFPIRSIILDRLEPLKGDYYAVHVRNTDLKTDYKGLFSRIAPEIEDKQLLVCSDDYSVIEYARTFFGSSKILVSSEIPDTQGQALHESGDRKNTIDAIVDLFALGGSKKLFFSNATVGYASGFSALAEHLHRNKYVIDHLLRTPGKNRGFTIWRLKQYRRFVKEYIQHAYYRVRYSKLGSIGQ